MFSPNTLPILGCFSFNALSRTFSLMLFLSHAHTLSFSHALMLSLLPPAVVIQDAASAIEQLRSLKTEMEMHKYAKITNATVTVGGTEGTLCD